MICGLQGFVCCLFFSVFAFVFFSIFRGHTFENGFVCLLASLFGIKTFSFL